MSPTQVHSMTVGRPLPILLRFALPLIFGSLLQQLYTFVDTAIVGRCIGSDALTAVGITGSLNFLVLGFTMGSAIGFCIPISQSVGAGDRTETGRNFWNGLYLSLTIGLLVSLGAALAVRPLLNLMNTPHELMDMAADYLTVILLGQIFTVLYNYLSGVLRAFGDSKRPFCFLLISGVLNVVLDLLFISVIPMGVVGAAVATVISQGVSALLCALWLGCKTSFLGKTDENGNSLLTPSPAHIGRICRMGLPLGLEYSVCSIGNVILQGSINALGTVAATAQICGERIRQIATLPMESMGTAMATYVGQNYGARRKDRIKLGIKCGLLIQGVYSLCAWGLLLLLKRPLVYLLLGSLTSPEALASIEYLTVITTLFIFHGSLMIFRNTVQGMGFAASTLASSLMEILGRSAAGLLAVRWNSFFLVCVSSPMAWVPALACCMVLCAYHLKKPIP